MAKFRTWLVGKKTYLLSGGLLLALVVLVALGKLTPVSAGALLLTAAFGFPATLKAALVRHHDEEIALLEEIAVTGAALAARNLPMAGREGTTVAEGGAKLVDEIKQEAAS